MRLLRAWHGPCRIAYCRVQASCNLSKIARDPLPRAHFCWDILGKVFLIYQKLLRDRPRISGATRKAVWHSPVGIQQNVSRQDPPSLEQMSFGFQWWSQNNNLYCTHVLEIQNHRILRKELSPWHLNSSSSLVHSPTHHAFRSLAELLSLLLGHFLEQPPQVRPQRESAGLGRSRIYNIPVVFKNDYRSSFPTESTTLFPKWLMASCFDVRMIPSNLVVQNCHWLRNHTYQIFKAHVR